MNVLSLFDGCSCGQVALERAGIKVNNYYASEIDKYAIKVTQANYPNTIQLGDVRDIKGEDLPKIDLLIGGSPCQSFSNAGKKDGFDGKSGLFFEFARLLEELNPKYFLLENVKMKKEWQDIITSYLCVEPIEINSSLVSAQNRKRFYWTNIKNIKKPKDLGKKLNDVLLFGYSNKDKSRALLESDSRPLIKPIKMCHRYFNTGFTTIIFKNKAHFHKVKEHFDKHFKNKSAKEIDLLIKDMDLSVYNDVRYMNCNERELCQTVPVGYTEILTKNQRASVLGNGWTVDVIAHILKNIKKEK